jgi:hypothetical protein
MALDYQSGIVNMLSAEDPLQQGAAASSSIKNSQRLSRQGIWVQLSGAGRFGCPSWSTVLT